MNWMRSILAVLIMFIPWYPKFPLLSVNGTYVAIRLDDIVVACSFLFFLVLQFKEKWPIFKEKIFYLFLAYGLAITITNIISFLIFQTTATNILVLHLLRRWEYMGLFFVAWRGILNIRDIKNIWLFLLLSLVGVELYGLGQKYFEFPVISTMNEEFSKGQLLQMDVWTRISSTFAGHYDLAAFLSVILIVVFWGFIVTKRWYQKLMVLIVWLVGFYLLTLTASRVAVFAFWGGVIMMLLGTRKFWWIIPVSLLVVISMFSAKDLNQRLLATIPSLKKQINKTSPAPTLFLSPTPTQIVSAPVVVSKTIPKPTTPTPTVTRHKPEEFQTIDADVGVARSGEIRFNVEWPRAINAFRKNWITGTGLGSISLATDNDFLRSLGESGIVGFITFTTIILFFVVNTKQWITIKKQTESHKLNIVFLSALMAMLANALFIDVFEASKVAYSFWIMMGIYYRNIEFSKKE